MRTEANDGTIRAKQLKVMALFTKPRAETDGPYASEIAAFFRNSGSQPVHIEYVPSPLQGQPKLLVEGPNIGIPKPLLLQEFISARRAFFSLLKSRQYPAWELAEQEQLLDSSLILLLIGSEHLTAVNARKKIVLLRNNNFATPRTEIILLTGILTSPLNKHNKSPLLWDYRRWLVENFGMRILGEGGLPAEMNVVENAGEIHPKNYYAWNYARFIIRHYFKSGSGSPSTIHEIVNGHAKFCESHVSDTSAWSFLFFLFSLWKSRGDHDRELFFNIISNVLELTVIAPGHESIWIFLRTVLETEGILSEGQKEVVMKLLLEIIVKGNGTEGHRDNAEERKYEKRAVDWIKKCQNRGCKGSLE